MRQLDVASPSSRPEASVIDARASAVRRPAETTIPSQRTGPVSAVIGRRKRTERSRLVYPTPAGSVDCTAHPQEESSSVA